MNLPRQRSGFQITKGVLRSLMRLLFRVTFHGDANEFVNERTLIVANHESFLDGLLLALFLPVDATYVVHTTVARNPLIRWCLRFIPHLLVDSTSPLAIKLICKLVESGKPVVIFPEGRLTVTGSLMKVYDGAAFIAAKTGAVVVPTRIEGAGYSYFGRLAGIYPLKLFPKITVTVLPRRTIPIPAPWGPCSACSISSISLSISCCVFSVRRRTAIDWSSRTSSKTDQPTWRASSPDKYCWPKMAYPSLPATPHYSVLDRHICLQLRI